jgi:hypothetical protein
MLAGSLLLPRAEKESHPWRMKSLGINSAAVAFSGISFISGLSFGAGGKSMMAARSPMRFVTSLGMSRAPKARLIVWSPAPSPTTPSESDGGYDHSLLCPSILQRSQGDGLCPRVEPAAHGPPSLSLHAVVPGCVARRSLRPVRRRRGASPARGIV